MNTIDHIILPVDIPNHVIRPIIYRIVTKQHNLLLTTNGLETLAYIIGSKAVGSDWRTTKLNYTKQIVDLIVKEWIKKGLGKKFDDKEKIMTIYRELFENKNNSKFTSADNENEDQMDLDPGNSTSIQNIATSNEIDNESSMINISMDVELEQDLLKNYNQFIKFLSFDEQPLLKYDHLSKIFRIENKQKSYPHKNLINPLLKSDTLIQRLELIKNKYLKNNNNNITKFTSAKDLLGRNEELFTLIGVVRKNFKNEWILEDPSGSVKLILSHLDYDEKSFFFIPGQIVILEGIYFTVGEEFQVANLSFPITESRGETVLKRLNKMDYLGINDGNKYVLDEDFWIKLEEINLKLTRNWIAFLGGDLFLDVESNFAKLESILSRFDEDQVSKPKFIVFQGSFTSKPLVLDIMTNSPNVFKEYSDNFNKLFQLISKFDNLKNAKTQFVFIPGDNDPWFENNGIYPRDSIPPFFVKKQAFPTLIPNCHFKSNPVRLVYLNQEILIVNHDYYKQFVSLNINIDSNKYVEKKDEDSFIIDKLERQSRENFKVANTIITQQHLFPHKNTLNWEFDHYLQLNPLPNSIILADTSCAKYETESNGVKVVNTGKFNGLSNESVGWWEYIPFKRVYVWEQL